MNQKHLFLTLVLVILLGMLIVSGMVLAQTSASYNLEWHVIGGGGQPAASVNYAVNSTAGQGAASPSYSLGSNYAVSGGFWSGTNLAPSVYLPLVVKRYP